jgi:hypothetical protein
VNKIVNSSVTGYELPWWDCVERVTPYVVRILTPRGHGTGFLFYRGPGLVAIATAAHVINDSDYWEEPIRIEHASGEPILLRRIDRAVLRDDTKDTAAILIAKDRIAFPEEVLDLVPEKQFVKVGADIGWLGFPAISGANMCFFGGRISAYLEDASSYLVDGVAINGVSGGPAFCRNADTNSLLVMGVLSAYIPNRATGESLPGLAVVRDVSGLHDMTSGFKSVDEAKEHETPPVEPPPPAEPHTRAS